MDMLVQLYTGLVFSWRATAAPYGTMMGINVGTTHSQPTAAIKIAVIDIKSASLFYRLALAA